jgi:hypothetical protein
MFTLERTMYRSGLLKNSIHAPEGLKPSLPALPLAAGLKPCSTLEPEFLSSP